MTIDIGPPFKPTELTQHDHFLTARWRLFSITGPGMFRGFSASAYERAGAGSWRRYGIAQHDPWVLHRATARVVDDELVAAAGLPQPVGEPLVHYSPGVDVRIGPPHRLGNGNCLARAVALGLLFANHRAREEVATMTVFVVVRAALSLGIA